MIDNHLSEEDIIKKYNNNWFEISHHQYLTEEFMIKYQDKISCIYISRFQKLSEEFIRNHKYEVYWDYISTYQNLSENFIIEFQNKLDWGIISLVQNLSLKFIIENIGKLNTKWLFQNEHISEKIKQDLKMYLEILS